MSQQQEGQIEAEVGTAGELVKLPTLNEFLGWRAFPNNSYLEEPGFSSLYVRKGRIFVVLDGTSYWCHDTLTIASVQTENPGEGTFTRFVERLVEKGLAVFVENTFNERFQEKLLKLGFIRVSVGFIRVNGNGNNGSDFLYNYEEHIVSATR